MNIPEYTRLNILKFNWVYFNTVILPYENSIEYISIQSSYGMKVQLSISEYSHLNIWKFHWVYLNTVILPYENSIEYISIPHENSTEYISIQSSYYMRIQLSISQYSHLTIWKFSWVYLNTVILTYENSVEYISIQSSFLVKCKYTHLTIWMVCYKMWTTSQRYFSYCPWSIISQMCR